jgi:dTMP kinase
MENLNILKNKLVVMESEDHGGKSTISKILNNLLNSNGIPSIYTFQPGDLAYGEHASLICKLCKSKEYQLDTLANFFAFLLDRAENTAKIIIPALESGKTVISDRYWFSSYCYQYIGKQLKQKFSLTDDFFQTLNTLASHFIEPDMVFYFKRSQTDIENTKDDNKDLFESESYQFKKRVHDAYQDLIIKYNFKVLEVDNNPEITLQRLITLANS